MAPKREPRPAARITAPIAGSDAVTARPRLAAKGNLGEQSADAEAHDVRPPHGETREQALAREFREELGCGVTIAGPWTVFENIYRHEGALGHEIVFAADIRLHDATLYDRDVIRFSEDDGTACTARWLAPAALPDGVALFPGGLAAALASRREPGQHPGYEIRRDAPAD